MSAAATIVFIGMCDASGAVELNEHLFAIANDEDNILRVYDADRGGLPVVSYEVSGALQLEPKGSKKKKKKKKQKSAKFPEADLEAATRLGDYALWMTSHGRNKSGEKEASRYQFFATTATQSEELIELHGRSYERLVDDLLASPSFKDLELGLAAGLPAKDGGLNIEGMTARPEGDILVGLRTPLAGARAISFIIENPIKLFEGAPPKFSAPILLDLGGGGIRAISHWRGEYWLVASGVKNQPSQLYRWTPPRAPQRVEISALSDLNPEAFFSPEKRSKLLLLSDDGERELDGKPCKKLKKSEQKSFRGRWIEL